MKAIREEIHPREDQSFVSFQYAMRRFLCPYHYHPEIELTLIVAGRGQRLVGDNLSPFVPGDLVLMGPELPHSYFHAADFDEGPKGAHSIVIQFLPEMANGLLSVPECLSLRQLIARASRGLSFGEKAGKELEPRLASLVQAQGSARISLLLEILAWLCREQTAKYLANPSFRPSLNQQQAGRAGRVCDWLVANFQRPITLAEAARKAHLAPTSFSRFFHRATNRSFNSFLNELRIGHACRLLLESDKTVAEIAYESGFENLSNFNRRFRDLKKATPREFRQSAKIPEAADGSGKARKKPKTPPRPK